MALAPMVKILSPKIGSTVATCLIFFSFWGGIVTILTFIMPLAYEQVELFIKAIPKYKLYVQEHFIPFLMRKIQNFDKDILAKVSALLEQASDKLLGFSFIMLSNVWEYTRGTLHLLIFIILLPIFNFYILKDGKTLTGYFTTAESLIDSRLALFIKECSQVILEFLKGLINVCLIMSVYYTTCFSIARIDFSLLLGIISGFAVAIPFAGILTSLSLTMIITIFHFGIDQHIIYVLLIYFFGQGLETYAVTPRIIGGKIGLSPFLMIIALICWGKLFGVVGLLIAIPMTCVLKVVFKNLLAEIKQ
jgi:predicted PurR-regulated permease PerM